MSRLLLLIFITLTTLGYSQTVDYYRNTVKASYGLFSPLSKQYHNPIGRAFNEVFENPKAFIGLQMDHPRAIGTKNISGEYGINYFLNQTKTIGDSVKLNWFANNFSLIIKADLLPRNRYIDFYLGIGPLIGSQRLIVKERTTEVYRNFNAALVPVVELRLQFMKRICIGAEGRFLYDLSNPSWKRHGSIHYDLDHSNFSGTTLRFFIGWCFDKVSS